MGRGGGGRPAHWTRAELGTQCPPSRAPSRLSSLPTVRAPLPQARPGPGFPQSQAKAPRPLPPGCGGAPAHLPPSPSPATRLRVAPGPSPGSAYLALDLLHHFGGWGLTSNLKNR